MRIPSARSLLRAAGVTLRVSAWVVVIGVWVAILFARLLPHHPLRQALQRVLPAMAPLPMLPARRSVFRRGDGVMLVTEVFLPDLLARPAPGTKAIALPMFRRTTDRGPVNSYTTEIKRTR